ncbi:MAG: hypothetical protein ACRDMV_05760 [Streptosporangiales bacterium]
MNSCAICSTTDRMIQAEPDAYACWRCSERLIRWLREVEACLLAMTAVPVVGGDDGRRTAVFESRSPANDDVISATDIRTGIDRHQPHPGAMAALTSWCAQVADERGMRGAREATPTALCGYLRGHNPWIIAQPWVDEYHAELAGVRSQVRSLAGFAPEPPYGKCWVLFTDGECGGPLFWTDERDALRCGDCGRIYTGHELVRWQVGQQEAS